MNQNARNLMSLMGEDFAGDKRVFNTLRGIANQYVKSEDDIEEIYQTFIAYYIPKWHADSEVVELDYKTTSKVMNYFRFCCQHFLRKQGYRKRLIENIKPIQRKSPEDPLQIVSRNEDIRRVRYAFRFLNQEQMKLIELLYWEGLQKVEIAQIVGIPETTCRNRITYAEIRMRDLLKQ